MTGSWVSCAGNLKPRWFGLTGFAALCGLYYFWTASSELGDLGGDSAVYLLMARYLSPWSTHSQAAEHFALQSLYPPLYPLLLAAFGGTQSLLVAHIITTTFLLLAFVLLYVWVRRLEWSETAAAGIVAVFALLPGTYLHALKILSENLYLAFTLGAFVAASHSEHPERQRWLWIAALCVAGAALVRSAGISLIAAFALYLLWRRPPKSVWLFLLAAIPASLWSMWKGGSGYFSVLAARFVGMSPAGLFELFASQLAFLWHGWVVNFSKTSAIGWFVASVIALAAFVGSVVRIYQRKLDGLYAVGYLLLILVWPFPGEAERFLLVIMPVSLVHCMCLWRCVPLSHGTCVRAWLMSLPLVALLLVGLPDLLLTVQRFNQSVPADLAKFRRSAGWYESDPKEAYMALVTERDIVTLLRRMPQYVPPEDCVFTIKPSLVALFADRLGVAVPKQELDQTAFLAAVRERGCQHFLMFVFVSPTYSMMYYPAGRLRASLTPVADSGPILGTHLPAAILGRWRSDGGQGQ